MPFAKFLTSATVVEKLTPPDKPEYAFIGRSNVGKSSLINMLMGDKKLAKVSSTPGKTQTINHFEVDGKWYLVDLPGYGYAKISKSDRANWKVMIDNYLMQRENLMCVFVLLDLRLPLQKNDLDFMNNLGENGVPFVIVYTKADKVGKVSYQKNTKVITNALLEYWEELPQQFLTSSELPFVGQAEILKFINETNLLF
jgi:GTP-binding protein